MGIEKHQISIIVIIIVVDDQLERRTSGTTECLLGSELVVVQSEQEIEARVTSVRHATQSKVEKRLTASCRTQMNKAEMIVHTLHHSITHSNES